MWQQWLQVSSVKSLSVKKKWQIYLLNTGMELFGAPGMIIPDNGGGFSSLNGRTV